MRSKENNKITGDIGEKEARKFLSKNGFWILGCNYQKPWGEIDVIAQKDKIIHFVEVKTVVRDVECARNSVFYPEDNINYKKKRNLSRIIQTYLSENRKDELDFQIDAIFVYLDKGNGLLNIEIIEDIDLNDH